MPAITSRPRRVRHATVDLGEGFTVNVTFDSAQMTPAWRAAGMDREDPLAVPRSLEDVILEWDVTAEDGSPYPPTAENLAVFSFDELGVFIEKMIDATLPGAAEGNAYANTSSTAVTDSASLQASLQNGQTHSPSPEPSASPSPT